MSLFFRNDKGIGLVGVLVAAAMVAIMASVVGTLISSHHEQSAKLELSNKCESIANDIVSYIKKDESSLFVSSYGPNGGVDFPSNLDTTEDGIDRFSFGGSQMSLFQSSGPTFFSLPSTKTELPAGWKYYNHLNIKNSTNRLIALAASADYCCDGLDMNNPNCGARFFDKNTPRANLFIDDKDIEVDFAIDFEGIACSGRRLASADVPDSKAKTKADFKVKVTLAKGTAKQKICTSTGTVQRLADSSPSLTLLEYGEGLCEPNVISPAVCGTPKPVVITVRTYKSKSGTQCETNCLRQTQIKTCNNIKSGGLSLFNTFEDPECMRYCAESEPGTSFLCKIGEKTWFDANPNFWEPCETATVRDFDGSPAGAVSINYNPKYEGNVSQKTSQAVITLIGLKPNRGYVADVRSVDTAGNIGPSFCNTTNGSPTCASATPHFTIINSIPSMSAIIDEQNFVAGAGQMRGAKSPSIAAASPKHGSALNAFAGRYQCEAGEPVLSGTVAYSPPLPGAINLNHTCTAIFTAADGSTSNIPCSCTGSKCTANPPRVTQSGNYRVAFTAANDCGTLPTIPDQNWCMDTNPNIDVTYPPTIAYGPQLNLSSVVIQPNPATKPCGVSTLCPNLDGSFTPVLGTSCPASNWSDTTHSGCVEDPSANLCMTVMDPCGRYVETNQSPALPAIKYSSTLAGVSHISGAASNYCFEFGGEQVGGNECEVGAYCTIAGKCYSTCEPKDCTTSLECENPNYGVLSSDADGPKCVAGKCTCPTNRKSPASASCAKKYCPVLNSCTSNIVATTPTGPTCTGCTNWQVGAESLCIGGKKTRTVSCPGSCCIGPKPWEESPCPDCVTPWGDPLTNGSSVTTFQGTTVPCGSVCASEVRTCNNGVLSGSFTQRLCNVEACSSTPGCWRTSKEDGCFNSYVCAAGPGNCASTDSCVIGDTVSTAVANCGTNPPSLQQSNVRTCEVCAPTDPAAEAVKDCEDLKTKVLTTLANGSSILGSATVRAQGNYIVTIDSSGAVYFLGIGSNARIDRIQNSSGNMLICYADVDTVDTNSSVIKVVGGDVRSGANSSSGSLHVFNGNIGEIRNNTGAVRVINGNVGDIVDQRGNVNITNGAVTGTITNMTGILTVD